MNWKYLVGLLIGLIGTGYASLPKSEQDFASATAAKYHLNAKRLRADLQKAHLLPTVIAKITRPYEARPWDVYAKHFLNHRRIVSGVQFWEAHQKVLALAEKRYGVDPAIIIAILGIETHYGEHLGNYRVLDTLTTLAFHYPPRAHFFTEELANFFVLSYENHFPPTALKGSYAGAFGMPQFMPSSYLAYGVDFSHNHHIDLLHNTDDVIMSVANFLSTFGCQANQPVATRVHSPHPNIPASLLSHHAKMTTSVGTLAHLGIHGCLHTPDKEPASVIALKTLHGPQYWLAFPNFRSIMHYNPNLNYVMAVYLLSQAIRDDYAQTHSPHRS